MPLHDELDRTGRAIAALEGAVAGLHRQLGPHPDVLRLSDDVASCATDLRHLQAQVGRRAANREPAEIPAGVLPPGPWTEGDVYWDDLGPPGRRAP